MEGKEREIEMTLLANAGIYYVLGTWYLVQTLPLMTNIQRTLRWMKPMIAVQIGLLIAPAELAQELHSVHST